MFKVTKNGRNRLDIELNGKLCSKEMKVALDELKAKADDIENGLMLYDVVAFRLPSIGAICIEIWRLPSMLGLIRKFEKAAVLTDKRWIKTISELEGALIPGLTIRAFGREQKKEAEAWLLPD